MLKTTNIDERDIIMIALLRKQLQKAHKKINVLQQV